MKRGGGLSRKSATHENESRVLNNKLRLRSVKVKVNRGNN